MTLHCLLQQKLPIKAAFVDQLLEAMREKQRSVFPVSLPARLGVLGPSTVEMIPAASVKPTIISLK